MIDYKWHHQLTVSKSVYKYLFLQAWFCWPKSSILHSPRPESECACLVKMWTTHLLECGLDGYIAMTSSFFQVLFCLHICFADNMLYMLCDVTAFMHSFYLFHFYCFPLMLWYPLNIGGWVYSIKHDFESLIDHAAVRLVKIFIQKLAKLWGNACSIFSYQSKNISG